MERAGAEAAGGGGAARDLAALFELELDTQKNQYETPQAAATSAEKKAREIDDALKKLDELAKREEDLAQQQRNGTQTAEQKWQQEMLQREAEQLQQRWSNNLLKMAKRGKGNRASRATKALPLRDNRADNPAVRRAVHPPAVARAANRPVRTMPTPPIPSSPRTKPPTAANRPPSRRSTACVKPIDDMKRAGSQNASAADARRAADRLREATDLLGGLAAAGRRRPPQLDGPDGRSIGGPGKSSKRITCAT